MSQQLTLRTKMKNMETLKRTLRLMGMPADVMQEAAEPTFTCRGYKGEESRVSLLVSKRGYGGTSDFGAVLKNGEVELYIDDYDSKMTMPRFLHRGNPEYTDVDFLPSVAKWYAAEQSMNALEAEYGTRPTMKVEGDKIRIQLSVGE